MKILVAIIATAFAILYACTGCMPNYSQGTRVGTVTKLSYKGFIFKSWEGELVQGGVRSIATDKGLSLVANTMAFNVADKAVITELEQAMKTGRRVELVYRQWAVPPLSIENDYVVIAVKPAD